jgi:tetratricopeptide (TPR) repeat protein
VIETNRILGPSEAFNPNFVIVPVETFRPARDPSGSGERKHKEDGSSKGSNQSESEKRSGEKGEARSDGNADQTSRQHGSVRHWVGTPSSGRTLLFAGLVALAAGFAGAWVESYFFGPSKSGGQKSSSKDSGSDKSSDSGGNSDSGTSSESGDSSDTRKNSTSLQKPFDKHQLLEAQEAWLTAVKELEKSRTAEKSARSAAEEANAVVDFVRRTLLSAGRSSESGLVDAFWAGGQGRDLTLRKAVDGAASRVGETFDDQPLAEASVRELLGSAYLNVGDAPDAVSQYERADALREAIQGPTNPKTAACRNQLAVAYRLAGRAAEAGRLFDRKPGSIEEASAMAVRGSTLLLEGRPAEAELKLRQALTIGQKLQPDNWATFDMKSMLGEALSEQNKFAEAESFLLAGYEGMKERQKIIPAEEKSRLTKALERLVKFYDAWGKTDQAMQWRKKLEASG